MLTQCEVVPYLLERKLVSEESIVTGDLMVMDASRRNRNFKVISELGPSYFLKQGVGPGGQATVAHEAAMYQLFGSAPGNDDLSRYLPCCYGYDPEKRLLILELLRNAQDLREYHARSGYFSISLAKAMGQALGAFHRVMGAAGIQEANGPQFLGQPPWVLSIHRPTPTVFRDVSHANHQLIKIVQQFGEFGDLLNRLRQEWRTETLIHSDLKWDNCIVFPRSACGRKTGLKIVDWELASAGDPCWDVGSVFNHYLSFWLLALPITGECPPDRFLELTRFPLERMQPALHSFWRSYVRQMELAPSTAAEWLLRAVQYGAARLVQTAFEEMQLAIQLTGTIVCFLQLSLNIMQRPQEAIVHLLGIPFGS